MNRDVEPIVAQLRFVRRAEEIKQKDVAAAIPVADQVLRGYELGYRTPTLQTLRLWAAALGYDVRLVKREAP